MMRARGRPISSARAAERSAERTIASRVTARASSGAALARVLVHETGQQLLVERTPVGADAHRLAVADRDLDDLAELQVALVLEADIAGIDAVFVERFGAGRMIAEQLVADIVEVADQRRRDAHGAEPVADMRHGRGGLVAVDGQAHQFGARPRQRRDLAGGRLDVGGVGVGHRLDDDRRAAADHHRRVALADANADGRAARQRPAGRFGHRKAHRRHPFPASRRSQLTRPGSKRSTGEFVILSSAGGSSRRRTLPQKSPRSLRRNAILESFIAMQYDHLTPTRLRRTAE